MQSSDLVIIYAEEYVLICFKGVGAVTVQFVTPELTEIGPLVTANLRKGHQYPHLMYIFPQIGMHLIVTCFTGVSHLTSRRC